MPLINMHPSNKGAPIVAADSIVTLLRHHPWVFGSHAHGTDHQLLWLNKGAGRVVLDGGVRGLAPNTAVYVPAGVVHAFQLTPISAGWVMTLPSQLPVAATMPPTAVVLPVHERAEQAALTALCDDINREQGSGATGESAALACLAGLLSVWLVRHLERKPPDAPVLRAGPSHVARFLRELEARHSSSATAGDYAKALGITPTHLTRALRGAVQSSATAQIQERKLLAAQEALAFGQMRIGALAQALGFGSPAYFTRQFAQATGTSPSAFRRTAQTAPVGLRNPLDLPPDPVPAQSDVECA